MTTTTTDQVQLSDGEIVIISGVRLKYNEAKHRLEAAENVVSDAKESWSCSDTKYILEQPCLDKLVKQWFDHAGMTFDAKICLSEQDCDCADDVCPSDPVFVELITKLIAKAGIRCVDQDPTTDLTETVTITCDGVPQQVTRTGPFPTAPALVVNTQTKRLWVYCGSSWIEIGDYDITNANIYQFADGPPDANTPTTPGLYFDTQARPPQLYFYANDAWNLATLPAGGPGYLYKDANGLITWKELDATGTPVSRGLTILAMIGVTTEGGGTDPYTRQTNALGGTVSPATANDPNFAQTFTFDTAQPDTNYAAFANPAQGTIALTNKTTTSFQFVGPTGTNEYIMHIHATS